MKRLTVVLLALAMSVLLTACGGNTNESEGTKGEGALPYEGVTIKFWSPVGDASYFEKLGEEYKEKTGATVVSSVIPWSELSAKYMTAFMTNNGPDVFYITSGLVADLYEGGRLLDLTDYLTEEDLKDRNFMETCYYNDILFGLPYNTSSGPRAWAFNLDILKKVGYDKAPATWDEFIDAAVKIKEANLCEYPVLFPMNGGAEVPLQTYLALLYSNGGRVANEECTEMMLDSEASVQTCQFIYDLVHKYGVLSQDCLSLDTLAVATQFYKGNAAMCPIYAEAPLYKSAEKVFYVKTKKGELKKIYEPFEYEVNFGISGNGNPAKSANPVDFLAANADSKNKECAVDFMKYLCKEGYQLYLDYYNEEFDSTEAVIIPPLFKGDIGRDIVHDWHREMIDHLEEHTFTMPYLTGCATMDVVYFSNVQSLIMGEITPEECAKAMQKECTEAMQG